MKNELGLIKEKILKVFFLFTFLLITSSLYAQTLIKGTVKDQKGQPLIGVTISIKGTTSGTVTDLEGRFSISGKPQDILQIAYIGYVSQNITLQDNSELNIILKEDLKILEEVVVVGFGTQKKVNLTGSVASVSPGDIENRPITQTSQVLSGLVSGVIVTQNSGRPGYDGSSIRIRGTGTFSGAGNDPLVLVDGIAASINDVDPNNIKSLSVLKDASSAAIYGTRAANGVIIIETKRGSGEKLQINYNNYFGWRKATELPQFLNSWEYATYKNEANQNEGKGNAYTEEQIEKFRSGSDPDNYPNVNHLKDLLESGSGFQTEHNLNISGGSSRSLYFLSLGYLRQNGLVAKNNYDRYNFVLNLDNKLADNLTLRASISGKTQKTEEPRGEIDMSGMIGYAVREGPIYAGRKSDGTYGYQDNYCPEGWLDSESFRKDKSNNFLGSIDLIWEVIKGLTLTGKAGYNYNNYTYDNFIAKVIFDQYKTVGPNSLDVNSGDNKMVTLQFLTQYNKQVGDHSFNILGGFSQEEYREDWHSGSRKDFPNNLLYELNAGSKSSMASYGSATEWGLRSFFGRINYSYKDRYLFEVNTRYDGTSRFPADRRWGTFPSFSAGWRLSEEAFIKDNIHWIDNLKLRVSWGKLGNQNIGNYPYQSVFSLGQNYSLGGTLHSGAKVTTLANKNISWETTKVTNIGLDFSILKNRLSLVVDYFDKTTSDILYGISVSSVLGLTPSAVNAGEVKNRGFEVNLDYRTKIGSVNVGIVPNISYIKNEVSKLANLEQDIAKGLFVSHPLNSIYGYVADGLFVDNNDISSYAKQPYGAEPGFIRYKDISGPDGVPDGVVDPTYDRKILGSSFPKVTYGGALYADYKGFDFSVIFQGVSGLKKRMGSYQAYAFYNGGQIQKWQADNRWTKENPNPSAEYLKLTNLTMSSGTIQTSSFWIRDASFFRIKNVQVGYTIPNSITEKMKISRLKVFFSGDNLLTFSDYYKGWDPEMGQATGDQSPFYPLTKVYTFGLNVSF